MKQKKHINWQSGSQLAIKQKRHWRLFDETAALLTAVTLGEGRESIRRAVLENPAAKKMA